MSIIRNNTILSFQANGIEEGSPLNINDVGVLATFGDGSQVPNITTENLEFEGAEAETIKEEIRKGNIYEKINYKITASNSEQVLTVFDGFKNVDSFTEDLEKATVSVNLSPKDDIRTFTEKLNSVTYGTLETEGRFLASDNVKIPYIVEKLSNVTEQLIILSSASAAATQAITLTKNLTDDTINTTSHGIGGLPPASTAAATTFGVAAAIFNAAYGISLVIQLKNIYTQFREAYYPPVRTHNVISFRTIMSRTCEHFGYTFSSTITELDNIHHLPSNLGVDSYGSNGFLKTPKGTPNGIPNISDGILFNCGGWFSAMGDMFQARIKIIDNVVHFERELSDFWNTQGEFIINGGFAPTKRYNTEDLNRSIKLAFLFDSSDIYTIENSDRTSTTIYTESTQFTDKTAIVQRGYLERTFPWALGNIKKTQTTFEKTLKGVLDAIKDVINVFGGSFGSGSADARLGALKVGTNNTQNKALWLEGGRIPSDHREKLNARIMWDNGINKLSFVENNYGGQYEIYEDVKNVGVGVDGFSKLIKSKFAIDSDGDQVELTEALWKMTADKLEKLSYKKPFIYTKKLKQTITDLT